jgi:KDO2-lipid IV(A) lauroyltransferase
MLRGIRDRLVYLLVRLTICWAQAVTIETCHRAARALAWLACDLVRFRRRVIDDNLRHVFPDESDAGRLEIARRMWEHLVLMVFELAHAQRKIHDTNWRQYIRVHRKREIVGCLLDGRPLVIVSGHFGNFEVAGVMLGLLGFPTFTVARLLDNPYLDRFLNGFRAARGQFMLPKDGSAQQVQAVLDGGGTLVLLGDQHAGPKGCWIEFLGRPASCHKAIALFSLTTGAPLLVAYARRLGKPLQFELGMEGVVDPAVDSGQYGSVPALTQWYNDMLEQIVGRDPEQYWWVHRRWKGEPPPRRKSHAAAA